MLVLVFVLEGQVLVVVQVLATQVIVLVLILQGRVLVVVQVLAT